MIKIVIGCGIALMVVLLAIGALVISPIRTCSTVWYDQDGEPIQGLYSSCPADLTTRSIGGMNYAQVGASIFRVQRIVKRSPGEGLRPNLSESLVFKKWIDGPAQLDKFTEFDGGGMFLSDGTSQFVNGHRVDLKPQLDFSKVKAVRPNTSIISSKYLSDGTWVLYMSDVVRGADAASFHVMELIRDDGLNVSSAALETLGVDRNAVYYGADRLEDADPATFAVIVYRSRSDAPPGVATSEPDGIVAFDRQHGWRINWTTIERFEPTAAQLKAMRDDLREAREAADSD